MADNKETEGKDGSKKSVDKQAKEIAIRIFRVTGAALTIWTLGWFNFHYVWVLIGLGTYLVWKWKQDEKKQRMKALREVTDDEKGALMRIKSTPAWVFFPDVQRAEWLNQVIKQMWPFLNKMVKKILKEKVEPEMQKKLPSMLQSLYFEHINLGSKNLKLGGVKVYTREVERSEILIDVDVIYAGDAEISLRVKGISAGISDLQLRGKLRIELKPLIPVSPLIGGISLYFLDCPQVDFDLTNLLNVLDIPGLSDILRCAVRETLCSFMVLPNRINIPLSDDERVESLRYPVPDGVLRIEVIEAVDLIARDINVFSKDSSDPYVVIKVGSKSFKTKTVEESLSPVWNEKFEVFADNLQGNRIHFNVYDADAGSQDEFLGSADISLEKIAAMGTSDMWLPLHKVPSGKIHVKCTWMTFSSDKNDLKEAVKDENESVAALFVKLDSAEHLPETDAAQGTSNPFCKITVGNQSKKSTTISDTKKPVWEQVFSFLIYNPKFQEVDITVIDEEEEKRLGKLDLSLSSLIKEPQMKLHQPFHLKEALANSQLHLIIELRALVTKPVKETSKEEEKAATGSDGTELRRRNVGKYPEIEACIWYDATKNKLRCLLSGTRYTPVEKEKEEMTIKLRLLPDKTAAGLRETKAFTPQSKLEEKFNYFISYDEVIERQLEIELELAENNETLAKTVIDLKDENLVNPETRWFKLGNSSE